MFKNNSIYVSPRYEKNRYLELGLSEDNVSYFSKREDFEKAVKIFEDRIRGYYLRQIETLAETNVIVGEDQDGNILGTNGFAIMALECLLVETLAQFKYGFQNTKNVSEETYVHFLMHDLSCCACISHARQFYSRIRCGILHQAQTKDRGGLNCQMTLSYPVYKHNSFLMVSIPAFMEKMNEYFESYCDDLRNPDNVELRKCFVRKMDWICGNIG